MKTRRAVIGSGIFAVALLIGTAVASAILPWLYPAELWTLRETSPTSLISPGVLVSERQGHLEATMSAACKLQPSQPVAEGEVVLLLASLPMSVSNLCRG